MASSSRCPSAWSSTPIDETTVTHKMTIKKLLVSVLFAFAGAVQAAGGGLAWDKFPTEKLGDQVALQNGAKLFVNYCLNCHSAAYMRFNRMADIGLTPDLIKGNLVFTTDKVGETMQVAIDPKQAKEWFGATPPDLSVIARSRSASYSDQDAASQISNRVLAPMTTQSHCRPAYLRRLCGIVRRPCLSGVSSDALAKKTRL